MRIKVTIEHSELVEIIRQLVEERLKLEGKDFEISVSADNITFVTDGWGSTNAEVQAEYGPSFQ